DVDAPQVIRVRQGMLHGIGFMLIFLPLIGALLLTGRQMIARCMWPGFGWYSLGTGLLAVVLILLIFRYAQPAIADSTRRLADETSRESNVCMARHPRMAARAQVP